MRSAPGIYVEILIHDEVEHVWRLTQDPALHERWDLRFSHIEYLPRPSEDEPQRFLYETRIGFGLSIKGTGQSVGERGGADGNTTSALKFASDDSKSLIREGSGYWKYVPTPDGLRFFTWYDYTVRFGAAGRLLDRLILRPIMGWATAWSFDRLRLWAEEGQTPETSGALSLIHATARMAIAVIWMWHGLVPKLIFRAMDERVMLEQAGLPVRILPWAGGAEIALGVLFLWTWHRRGAFVANGLAMLFALTAVAIHSPEYFKAAFNPVTLNLAMIALSVVGWISASSLPTARRCRRKAPTGV